MINRRQLIQTGLALGALSAMGTRAFAQNTRWRHAIVASKGDAGFFYMPQEKGFWAEQGLDVEIVEMKGSKDVIRALLAGEVDSSDSIPADMLPAWERGVDLRVVGSTIIGYPYAMYVRPEINDWAELEGKTFGVSGPGSAPHMFALAMMKTAGVPTASMKIANAGGSTGRIKALSVGTLDATAGSTEFIPDAEMLGIKVLGLAEDMAPLFPRFVLTMAGTTVDNRAEEAARFSAGYVKGLRYAVENRDETIALSAAKTGGDVADTRYSFSFDEIVNNKMISLDLAPANDRIAWMQDIMLELGEMKQRVDFTKYIDTTIRDAAIKRLTSG